MIVRKYTAEDKRTWDDFVTQSKNGNFHVKRDFVEYHADRFTDHSLMIYDEGSLVAVLPGHQSGDRYGSHSGLTYGGFILPSGSRTTQFIGIFEDTLSYLIGQGFKSFFYKTIPYIYHKFPAEEDRHAMFAANARLVQRHILPVVHSGDHIPFQERRRRSIKKAVQAGMIFRQSDDIETFWNILETLLLTYNSKPVHSLEEIKRLIAFFPENIKIYAGFLGDKMMAGLLIFESEMAARGQYIASSEEGKNIGALDFVIGELLNNVYLQKPWFDFGTTTLAGGLELNPGLSDQKEGFGARTVVHDAYEIDLTSWIPQTYYNFIK